MSLTYKSRKILAVLSAILLLLLLMSSCFADTMEYSFQLLDSPGGSTVYRLTITITDTLYEYYQSQSHTLYGYDFSKFTAMIGA